MFCSSALTVRTVRTTCNSNGTALRVAHGASLCFVRLILTPNSSYFPDTISTLVSKWERSVLSARYEQNVCDSGGLLA